MTMQIHVKYLKEREGLQNPLLQEAQDNIHIVRICISNTKDRKKFRIEMDNAVLIIFAELANMTLRATYTRLPCTQQTLSFVSPQPRDRHTIAEFIC